MTTLTNFQNEAFAIGFNKVGIRNLVKKYQKKELKIYYAYHEDGENTWAHGWITDDYKERDSDVLIFKATDLICKKKSGGRAFVKAQTYTSECAILVFASLSEVLKDDELSEKFISVKKAKSDEYAEADWKRAKEHFANVEKWKNLPSNVKDKITELEGEETKILGTAGSKHRRKEINAEINALGGREPILQPWSVDWITFANSFESVEDYKKAMWKKKLAEIKNEAAKYKTEEA